MQTISFILKKKQEAIIPQKDSYYQAALTPKWVGSPYEEGPLVGGQQKVS